MTITTRILRAIRVRPRLLMATLIGLSTPLLLPPTMAGSTRALVAWNIGVGLYLALAWTMMVRGSVEKMRWRAKRQDDGALAVLALTVVAALASLAAIVLELIGIKNHPPAVQTFHIVLAAGTILCSWCLVHTAFALHYAHEFYDDDRTPGHACLEFPGNMQPDYVDFLYFSFVIGTTSQTADINIASSTMRRFALVHGVIAFFFNTTLLALAVNIAAGLI